ncbi:MAG: nucleotidyl transferase AbiEii/AbiGii toxin family protein [Solirubrobacteraceae bacterium]
MTYKPPRRPPGDRSHLERLVQALSVEEGIAADRLRRWVSTQVLLGALGRGDIHERRFLLKGGVAIELRMRLRARATRDVDIVVLPEEDADLIETLRETLEDPYLNFGFRLARIQSIENTSAQRMDVKMTYGGRPWATLRLEASPPGAERAEAEEISAFSLTQLGLDGPEQVACQSLRYQIATKLHAVTERFETGENDRFRDLIDLLLLRELQPDLARVAEACREVFKVRAKQPWPPHLSVEPSWPEQYRALAVELDFAIQEAAGAVELVQALIDEIDAA